MASHHPTRRAAIDDSIKHLGRLDQVRKMENFAFTLFLCILTCCYRTETASFNLVICIKFLGLTLRRRATPGKDLCWPNLGLYGIRTSDEVQVSQL